MIEKERQFRKVNPSEGYAMTKPLVSVIIPVYNGEAYLGEAVQSVRVQGYEPLEIIIVDDGSTDQTKKVVANLEGNVRYIYQQNGGPPAARNTGLRAAKGELIAFLDADDLWPENKLEIQTRLMVADESIDVLAGHLQLVKASEQGSGLQLLGLPGPATSLAAALIRKKSFDMIGVLDESLPYDDDVDWFLRAKEAGLSVVFHPDVMLFYRRHANNISNDAATNARHFVLSLKKSLERRRNATDGIVKPLPRWVKGERHE